VAKSLGSVKSFSGLYKQARVLLLSPVFSVSGTMSMVGIAMHFLGVFTVYKFAFVI